MVESLAKKQNLDKLFVGRLWDTLFWAFLSRYNRTPCISAFLFSCYCVFQASDRMIRRFTPSPAIEDMKQIAAIDKTDLTQSVLGLQFWVTSEHFLSSNNGNRKLKVKCRQGKNNSRTGTESVAHINPIWYRGGEYFYSLVVLGLDFCQI